MDIALSVGLAAAALTVKALPCGSKYAASFNKSGVSYVLDGGQVLLQSMSSSGKADHTGAKAADLEQYVPGSVMPERSSVKLIPSLTKRVKMALSRGKRGFECPLVAPSAMFASGFISLSLALMMGTGNVSINTSDLPSVSTRNVSASAGFTPSSLLADVGINVTNHTFNSVRISGSTRSQENHQNISRAHANSGRHINDSPNPETDVGGKEGFTDPPEHQVQ